MADDWGLGNIEWAKLGESLKSLKGDTPKVSVQSSNSQATDITVSPIMSLSSPGSPQTGGGYDVGPSVSNPLSQTDQSGRGTGALDSLLGLSGKSNLNTGGLSTDLMGNPVNKNAGVLDSLFNNPMMLLLLAGAALLLFSGNSGK